MDIYELLNAIIPDEKTALSSRLFTDVDKEKLDENAKPLYDLVRDISSMSIEVENINIKFHPMVIINGQRSFAIEDITDDNYEMLKAIDLQKVPLVLRSLIADILWTQKKDYKAAQVATKAYWALFQLRYTDRDNIGTLKLIRRAVCISVQAHQKSPYSEIDTWFRDFLKDKAIKTDAFFSLRLMELFAEQKNYNVSEFLSVLTKIISLNSNHVSVVEQAYQLKTKCLHKLKKGKEATANNLSLAEYYVGYAEKALQTGSEHIMRVEQIFKQAISLYRTNGAPFQAEKTHKRLVEIQKEIPKNMSSFCVELDTKDVTDTVIANMDGLTFEESVIRLTLMFNFDRKESIKSNVIKKCKDYPLSYALGKNIKNAEGQTIFVLPPIDIANPEKDQKILELYMHQDALEIQRLIGDIPVKTALSLIRERFVIDDPKLEFLVKNNCIIPKGREHLFQCGIGMFLRGEFYEAMHILAPQTENLFRNIAKEVGGLTVTLENDGSSNEKVLSSIFTLPEMLDCYDNDILFVFKGLLNEQAGANIRNKVAHGMIEAEACSSGACLYFGAALIKLLTYTSIPCYQLLKSSEKLKCLKRPVEA